MEVACPGCQLAIDIRQSSIGMRIHCPGCGETFRVPAEDGIVDPADVWITDDEAPPAAGAPKPVARKAGQPGTKTCPMCGEQEDVDARRCRYCGEVLAGFQGADGYSIEGIWRDGNRLVMSKDAVLPAICVQTNRPTTERLRRKLYWHSPWLYFMLVFGLIGLIALVIVGLIVRQSADITVGLCRGRIIRRRWIIAGAWLGCVIGIAVFMGGIIVGDKQSVSLGFFGLVLFLASLLIGNLLGRVVVATKITPRYVWLKGVHFGYLAALPQFPGESRDR